MPKTLTPKPPALVVIPAGTPASRCKRCPETIYFVGTQPLRVATSCKSRSSGRVWATPDAKAPTATEAGLGWSHWVDCAQAALFRRNR